MNPVDLQSMYSQINNVSKQASYLQQGLQLSHSMQNVDDVKKNLEKLETIKQTNEESSSSKVNKDGNQNQNDENNKKNRKENDSNSNLVQENSSQKNCADYLGRHIDIMS